MGGRLWNSEEDRMLLEIYESDRHIKHSGGLIAGRSAAAMEARLKTLMPVRRKSAPWTPREDGILRAVWAEPGSLKSHLARLPGRSWRSALVRAERLGLGARPAKFRATTYSWVADEVNRVLEEHDGLTVAQIAARSAASYERAAQVLNAGHGTRYHIVGWYQPRRLKNGGSLAPCWALGAGVDVPRPAPKLRAVVTREYRVRKQMRAGVVNPFAGLMAQVAA